MSLVTALDRASKASVVWHELDSKLKNTKLPGDLRDEVTALGDRLHAHLESVLSHVEAAFLDGNETVAVTRFPAEGDTARPDQIRESGEGYTVGSPATPKEHTLLLPIPRKQA